MSSRRANPRLQRLSRRENARAVDLLADHPGARTQPAGRKVRGRRQPQPEDFQVTAEMPRPLPILDKELRAIEILLCKELLDLIRNDKKDS